MKINKLIKELEIVRDTFGNKDVLICPKDKEDGYLNCHFKMENSTSFGNRVDCPKREYLLIDIWKKSDEILFYLTEE